MEKSRFSEEQIIAVLKEHQVGVAMADLWVSRILYLTSHYERLG
jgi:hypothetical protein